ncbi:ATP-binding cassette domain-containing protein [bacterium]|nr:ATP-binding cassette domain-containing protein [bacterium]
MTPITPPAQIGSAPPPAIVREADTTPGTRAAAPWSIRLENLGKHYRLGETVSLNSSIREDISAWIKGAAGRLAGGGRTSANNGFWALRGVDLELKRGETLGIIGRNGAGKSTMLKLLSRITPPTEGTIRYRGRLASLLEVGTGFHRELSGRENIYLNGAILGMTRSEIDTAFDAIVDFAGVERFLDTPVKRYSSGMYVRLAFAVAAHLRTDILVVDEVLAVGDMEFQKKCLGKMQDVAGDGRTVLFVSHNMPAVLNLCRRGVVLKQGTAVFDGDVQQAVELATKRESLDDQYSVDLRNHPGRPGTAKPFFTSMELIPSGPPGSTIQMGEGLTIVLTYDNDEAIPDLRIGISVSDEYGQRITSFSKVVQDPEAWKVAPPRGRIVCTIPRLSLISRTWVINLHAATASGELDFVREATSFQIYPADVFGTGRPPDPSLGTVFHECRWEVSEIEAREPRG